MRITTLERDTAVDLQWTCKTNQAEKVKKKRSPQVMENHRVTDPAPGASEPARLRRTRRFARSEDLLTVREAAFLLRTSANTLRHWARKKLIPGYRVCGEWRFFRREIQAWIRARRER